MITLNHDEGAAAQPPGSDNKKQGNSIGFIIIALVVLIGLAAFILPNFNRPGNRSGQFYACQSNMKNIGAALEMYSVDNAGRYPHSMTQLTPNYLKTIPSCPAANTEMVYVNSYTMSTSPDLFTFYCMGHFHAANKVPPNYPQYNALKGLLVRP